MREKGENPIEILIDIKIKKEKKQSNYTNPDTWGRLIGRINTAPTFFGRTFGYWPFGYWLSIIND